MGQPVIVGSDFSGKLPLYGQRSRTGRVYRNAEFFQLFIVEPYDLFAFVSIAGRFSMLCDSRFFARKKRCRNHDQYNRGERGEYHD